MLKSGLSEDGKKRVLEKHNQLRQKVASGGENGQPGASNMRKLVWNDEVEKIAQRWADQCSFGHDNERSLCDGTSSGQNSFIQYSSKKSNEEELIEIALQAIQSFYDEVKLFPSSSVDEYR